MEPTIEINKITWTHYQDEERSEYRTQYKERTYYVFNEGDYNCMMCEEDWYYYRAQKVSNNNVVYALTWATKQLLNLPRS